MYFLNHEFIRVFLLQVGLGVAITRFSLVQFKLAKKHIEFKVRMKNVLPRQHSPQKWWFVYSIFWQDKNVWCLLDSKLQTHIIKKYSINWSGLNINILVWYPNLILHEAECIFCVFPNSFIILYKLMCMHNILLLHWLNNIILSV